MPASLMPMPKQAFYGLVNGVHGPIVGGKVYTYEAGTTTPKDTYTTAAGDVANPNPVVLDARGEASVWLGSGAYDIVLKDAADALIWTQENVDGGSSQVWFLQSGSGAVGRTAQSKMREIISVTDFYANGSSGAAVDPTGVVDSTLGIQAALNAGYDVEFPEGTYKITSTITVAASGYQRIVGRGDVTLSVSLASSIDLFVFNGPVSLENIKIDFNNLYCRYGLKWASSVGNIRLKNLRFTRLKDIDSTTGSIVVFIPPTGNTFQIEGIRADTMLKRGNGNVTDAAGSLNIIYIGGSAGSTQGSIKDVYLSEVHNIDASDVIIYEDTAGIYIATDATDSNNAIAIDNIEGYNFGKRLLKIHASNVKVSNVTGVSPEGDSLGVIGFLNGQGLGDKYGCSAAHVRASGKMEFAFSASAYGVKWRDVIAYTTPGTKSGMSNGSFGLLINGDDTAVDGLEVGSAYMIGIGSSASVIKNTRLRNLKMMMTSAVSYGLLNTSDTTGFDGLLIDGAYVVHDGTSQGLEAFSLGLYLNGTTKKGRNLVVNNVTIISPGPTNSYGFNCKYCENVSFQGYRYINTSANSHFRLAIFESCVNVTVDNVFIEGANQIGVFLKDCTGRNTVSRVQNTGATTAAVYNNNSTDVFVNNCDPAKVSGATTATPQNSKWTVGITANRPTTGLVSGFSQHFDTTLGKPIWWDGSVWKDAAGTTV